MSDKCKTSGKLCVSKPLLVFSFFYIALSDVWGLNDFNKMLPFGGELYDVSWLLFLFLGFLNADRNKIVRDKTVRNILYPVYALMIYSVISGIALIMRGTQNTWNTLMVVREVLYLTVAVSIPCYRFDFKKIMLFLIEMDCIGCVIYMFDMILGPLTPYHTAGIFEPSIGLFRGWSVGPVFSIWLVPLMVLKYGEKDYFFSKKKDRRIIILFVLTYVLKISRGAMIALLFALVLSYVKSKGESLSKKQIQFLKIALILIVAIGILVVIFPSYVNRFVYGIASIFSLEESTFTVRTDTIFLRWVYLTMNNRLTFGLGPLHNEKSGVVLNFTSSLENHVNAGVIAPDTAYGTILLRYGIAGIVLFTLPMVYSFFKLHKSEDSYNKAFALYGIATLISAFTAHGAFGFHGMLQYGFVMGMTLKEYYYCKI